MRKGSHRLHQQAARPLCPYYRARVSPRQISRLRRTSNPYENRRDLEVISSTSAGENVVRALLRQSCRRWSGGENDSSAWVAPESVGGCIVDLNSMQRRVLISVSALLLLLVASSVWADDRAKAKEQVEFGIKVAQNGLWNEALYRWKRAVEIDPSYAAGWNNLAIAFEHEGRFEEAKQAYEKAIQLDSKNMLIKQNYDLFKEINERTKRRGAR